MKQHTLHSSHHCQSIKHYKNEDFTCTQAFVIPRPMIRCTGNCFQRGIFYQQTPCISHPAHRFSCPRNKCPPYYSIPPTIVQPWSVMPLHCNPPFHESSCSKTIKSLDPSSYRITVRRMTPSHVARTAAEAYRTRRNQDSDRIHLRQFNQIIATNHQQTRRIQTNQLNSDDQNIPSVPSKKIVSKNNGTQVSSTSFITTTDDQNGDSVSDKSSEHLLLHAQAVDESSSSIIEVEKSNKDSFSLSEFNSSLPNNNIINTELPLSQITISRKEDITTKENLDNVSNESQTTKHIESKRNSVTKDRSSIQSQPAINNAENHEWYSLEEKISPSEFLRDDISNIDIIEPRIELSSFNIAHPSTRNLNTIKSNERLLHSSQSVKSITSLINKQQKSFTNINTSNLALRTTRSILDLGLLVEETAT